MININFLANRVNVKGKQKKQDIKIFKISTYVAAGIFIVLAGALGFKLYTNLRINNAEKQIEQYKQSILGQESTEVSYLIFANKIKVIGEIYKNRSNKQEAMNYFSEVFGGKAEIIGMNYQADQGGLILQLSSDNVFNFQAVEDTLDSSELRQAYDSVEKSALSRTETGSYKLTIKLGLKAND